MKRALLKYIAITSGNGVRIVFDAVAGPILDKLAEAAAQDRGHGLVTQDKEMQDDSIE